MCHNGFISQSNNNNIMPPNIMLNLVSTYSVTLKEAIVPHKLLKVSPNQVVQVSETESTPIATKPI